MEKIHVRCTRENNQVISLGFEEYIRGVVASEIGNAPLEACKAQAVAARTTAIPYQQSGKTIDDTGIQAFRQSRLDANEYPNSALAVGATEGEVLFFDSSPLSPCSFSASNGGRTTSSEHRWGGYRPYLIEQDDPYDLAATGGKKAGHGVGMSQRGAIEMAKRGFSYEEILSFYYPGSVIMKKGVNNMATKTVRASYQVEKFVFMADNKWKYVAKAAEYGKVDCSGAFYYWYKQAGSYMFHGSNTMWRQYAPKRGRIGEIALVPGMAVYKHKNDGKEPEKYQNDGMGNFYHVGLYIGNGRVVEAKGTKYGVVYSDVDEWTHCSTLKYTEYDLAEKSQATAGTFPCEGVVTTNSGVLNVREKPTTSSRIVKTLPKGSVIEVFGANGNWYEIGGGYVSSSYVTLRENEAKETYTVTFTVESRDALEVILAYLSESGIKPRVLQD